MKGRRIRLPWILRTRQRRKVLWRPWFDFTVSDWRCICGAADIEINFNHEVTESTENCSTKIKMCAMAGNLLRVLRDSVVHFYFQWKIAPLIFSAPPAKPGLR